MYFCLFEKQALIGLLMAIGIQKWFATKDLNSTKKKLWSQKQLQCLMINELYHFTDFVF